MAGGDVKERMNMLIEERQRQAKLSELRRDTIRKADFLRKKAIIEHHEVYQFIRDFFKEFLGRRYEFTINELRQELKTTYIPNITRQQITIILSDLEAIEYTNVEYKHEDLVRLLETFKQIVDQLIKVHTNSRSFAERVKGFLFKPEQPSNTEVPVEESEDTERVRIYTLIEKCYIALDKHNIEAARLAYDALIMEYNNLEEDIKEHYYPTIEQTYNDFVHRINMIK